MKFAWFGPLGPSPWAPIGATHNFESPTPKDDSCHFWLKSNHAFSKRRWNSYFLQRAHRGPLGPPWELPWKTFVPLNKVSTHYITWLFPSGSGEEDVWQYAWFWPFGALPLGPHRGHTYIWTTLQPLRMIPALNHARRRWKCKKFTDDGRRTTHDARRTTDENGRQ